MKALPQFEREELEKLPASTMVDIILRQQESIQKLFEEIERLKAIINRDSSNSSKPPSSDLLKRTEKKPPKQEEGKRKAGGQPGHEGKTRKGFGRVDRIESVHPSECPHWVSQALTDMGLRIRQISR
jgi:transposase